MTVRIMFSFQGRFSEFHGLFRSFQGISRGMHGASGALQRCSMGFRSASWRSKGFQQTLGMFQGFKVSLEAVFKFLRSFGSVPGDSEHFKDFRALLWVSSLQRKSHRNPHEIP